MLYLFGEPVVSLTAIHNNIINIVLAAQIATMHLENQKFVATSAIVGFEVRIVE